VLASAEKASLGSISQRRAHEVDLDGLSASSDLCGTRRRIEHALRRYRNPVAVQLVYVPVIDSTGEVERAGCDAQRGVLPMAT